MSEQTATPTAPETVTPAQAYETYFGPAIFEPLARLVVERATPRPGEHALDVACGTGIVTRHLASRVGGDGHVVGVDLNPGMLDVARTLPVPAGASIDWRQGDAANLELPDDRFDLLVCQQGLQFVPDRAAAVAEMHRVLRPGGRVVLAVWKGLDHHPLYAAMADAEEPHLAASGLPVTRAELTAPFSLGDATELTGLLADAGFRDVEVASGSIEARFTDPDRFVERMEFAYAAVVPQFAEDRDAFAAYLADIQRETAAIVEHHRVGDRIVVPMHAHLAVARP